MGVDKKIDELELKAEKLEKELEEVARRISGRGTRIRAQILQEADAERKIIAKMDKIISTESRKLQRTRKISRGKREKLRRMIFELTSRKKEYEKRKSKINAARDKQKRLEKEIQKLAAAIKTETVKRRKSTRKRAKKIKVEVRKVGPKPPARKPVAKIEVKPVAKIEARPVPKPVEKHEFKPRAVKLTEKIKEERLAVKPLEMPKIKVGEEIKPEKEEEMLPEEEKPAEKKAAPTIPKVEEKAKETDLEKQLAKKEPGEIAKEAAIGKPHEEGKVHKEKEEVKFKAFRMKSYSIKYPDWEHSKEKSENAIVSVSSNGIRFELFKEEKYGMPTINLFVSKEVTKLLNKGAEFIVQKNLRNFFFMSYLIMEGGKTVKKLSATSLSDGMVYTAVFSGPSSEMLKKNITIIKSFHSITT